MRINDGSSDVCSSDLLCCSAGAICPPLHENEFCRTERAASPQYPQALSPTILGLGQIVFNPLEIQHGAAFHFLRQMRGSSVPKRFVESLSQAFPIKRSEEHTSELQSLMRISYAVFCLKKKKI